MSFLEGSVVGLAPIRVGLAVADGKDGSPAAAARKPVLLGNGAENAATPKGEEECSVCVAVKIRPLVPSEVEQGSRCSLVPNVAPGVSQVSTGQHTFNYDYVFGEGGAMEPSHLYPRCVAPLVDSLFRGYNATVFAYGQTGSGKTYTMGSEYKPGGPRHGVIPEAIHALFSRIESNKDAWQSTVRVSFVEIHKEEVRDLLYTAAGPRPAVSIREVPGGGVCLYGTTEKEVRSAEECAAVLEMGTLCRATASTGMNNRSSRSHAIFSVTLEQRRTVAAEAGGGSNGADGAGAGAGDEEEGDDGAGAEVDAGIEDYLCAKMHLVDLAGSERAKRTKAEGARLKEGIHINRGLLALGNVINAIVDNHKHVPYRDSKLTRLLQDSLGGNSRTLMIACVSPADINFEESLNTLRYADRARHIRNKPMVNRDPVAAQVAFLRQQLAAARAENSALKRAILSMEAGKGLEGDAGLAALLGIGGSMGAGSAGSDVLQSRNTALELEVTRLKIQLEDVSKELAHAQDRSHGLQAQLDIFKARAAAASRRATAEAAAAAAAATSSGGAAAATGAAGDGSATEGGEGAGAAAAAGGAAGEEQTVEAEAAAAVDAMDLGDAGIDNMAIDVAKVYLARIAELERELRHAKQLNALGGPSRRRTTATHGHHHGARTTAGGAAPTTPAASIPGAGSPFLSPGAQGDSPRPMDVAEEGGSGGAGGRARRTRATSCMDVEEGLEEELEDDMEDVEEGSEGEVDAEGDAVDQEFYAKMAAHTMQQEKMALEVAVLQKQLEAKERKMAELVAGSGAVPALKQHYDRVLAELAAERDRMVAERNAIKQKLEHLAAASEEERKRLEAHYKEKLASYDQRLRELRHKERDFISMQKLKARTEEMCKRLGAEISRLKAQKVAVQKAMEANAKQFASWRVDRERELVQLRRQNRRNVAHIEELRAMQAKQNAVLQRKIADANAARKKLREMQLGRKDKDAAAAAAAAAAASEGASGGRANAQAGPTELQPNAGAPLLRNEKARRDWVEQELDLCSQSFEYRRVLEGELAQRAEVSRQLREVEKRLMLAANLPPTSPLVPAGAGPSNMQLTPAGPGVSSTGNEGVSGAVLARLTERKKQLEKELEEHNSQITELQGAWERAKEEEEGRGGGAADARRWTGVRSGVEARELLRTVFRVACDYKAAAADASLEAVKVSEEAELLRVQLDAARKEAEAQKKRAESAATAVTSTGALLAGTPRGASPRLDSAARAAVKPLALSALGIGGGPAGGAVPAAGGRTSRSRRGSANGLPPLATLRRSGDSATGVTAAGVDAEGSAGAEGAGGVEGVTAGSTGFAGAAGPSSHALMRVSADEVAEVLGTSAGSAGRNSARAHGPGGAANEEEQGPRQEAAPAAADETDLAVEELLAQLQSVAQTPAGADSEAGQGAAAGRDDDVALGSPAIAGDGALMGGRALADALDKAQVASKRGGKGKATVSLPDLAAAGGAKAKGRYRMLVTGGEGEDDAMDLDEGEEEEDEEEEEGSEGEEVDAGDVEGSSSSDDEDEEDEEEEDSSSESDGDDMEWDPCNPTPARRGRAAGRARAAAAAQKELKEAQQGSGGQGPLPPSKRTAPEPSSNASSAGPSSAAASPARRPARRTSSLKAGALAAAVAGVQGAGSADGAGSAASSASEVQVLEAINAAREAAGLAKAAKLTVKLLKEALAGQMVGGKLWRAGTKTRDQLVADYRTLMGLTPSANSPATSGRPQEAAGPAAAGASQQASQQQPAQQGDVPTSPMALGSPYRDYKAAVLSPRLAPGAALGKPSGLSSPRAAAAGTSGSPRLLQPSNSFPRSPRSPAVTPRAAAAKPAPASPRAAVARPAPTSPRAAGVVSASAGAGFTPLSPGSGAAAAALRARTAASQPSLAPSVAGSLPGSAAGSPRRALGVTGGVWSRAAGAIAGPSGVPTLTASTPVMSPLGLARIGSAGGPGSALGSAGAGPSPRSTERTMTPLSLLYIQKAQEARERTAALRSSIQKSVTNATSQTPTAAAAIRMGSATPPAFPNLAAIAEGGPGAGAVAGAGVAEGAAAAAVGSPRNSLGAPGSLTRRSQLLAANSPRASPRKML